MFTALEAGLVIPEAFVAVNATQMFPLFNGPKLAFALVDVGPAVQFVILDVEGHDVLELVAV